MRFRRVEIRSRCSRFWARNSSFTFKGQAVDVKRVGEELGVRYVMEGSVRRAGDRIRITAQLVDAATGSHVWADRYDRALEDIFDLQDEVTESVVGAIEPHLNRAEFQRIREKRPESLDAYDYTLRGLSLMNNLTPGDTAEALALFHQAIEADPDFALAYAALAESYSILALFSEVPIEKAERAVELSPGHAAAHYLRAEALLGLGRSEEAAASFSRARDLDLRTHRITGGLEAAFLRAMAGSGARWVDPRPVFQADLGVEQTERLFADHVHPTRTGHRELALLLRPSLRRALEPRSDRPGAPSPN